MIALGYLSSCLTYILSVYKITKREINNFYIALSSVTSSRLATKIIKEIRMTSNFPEQDRKELQVAKNLLENPGVAAKVTNFIGTPVEKG